MNIVPYLNFVGNAEEAIHYYAKAFDGKILTIMRYSENPDFPVSEGYQEKIMHAQLQIGDDVIYVSDAMENIAINYGDHVYINVNFDNLEQIKYAYEWLSKDAEKITNELADTFWRAKYASLVDKYGFGWSLNYTYPEEEST